MRRLAIFSFSFAAAILVSQYFLGGVWPLYIAGALLVVFAGCVLWLKPYRAQMLLILVGLGFGLVWNFGYGAVMVAPARSMANTTMDVRVAALDYATETDYGLQVPVRLILDGVPDMKAMLYSYDDQPQMTLIPGDIINTTAYLRMSDYDTELNSHFAKGEFLILTAKDTLTVEGQEGKILKYLPVLAAKQIKDKISVIFPDDTMALVTALVTGDKTILNQDTELSAALTICGLAHIVAVSGMHVSFLMGLITLLCGKRLGAFIGIPVIICFMAIVGGTPSVMRAGIMQIMLLLAGIFKRENDTITALGAALMLVLLINPYSIKSVGLQLSYACMVGINIFGNKINSYMVGVLKHIKTDKHKIVGKIWHFISASVSITIAALVLSTPLSAMYFGQVPVMAPVVNLLVLPAISVAFPMSLPAIILGFVYEPLGVAAAYCVSWLIRYVTVVAVLISRFPYASVYLSVRYVRIWLLYLYVMMGCVLVLPKEKRHTSIPLLCAVAALTVAMGLQYLDSTSDRMRMTVLDVGQGQSILLESKGQYAVLDCGGTSYMKPGQYAAEYICSLGSGRVDYLILSHFHRDHAGGAIEFLSRIEVETLIVPAFAELDKDAYEILAFAKQHGIKIIYVDKNMSFSLGESTIKAFAPMALESENEKCMAVLCTLGKFDALVMADLSSAAEQHLMMKNRLPDIELLIAGHHGSKTATSNELLDAVLPEATVISVGENSYGHPSDDVLERLWQRDIAIYRTDKSGSIEIGVR